MIRIVGGPPITRDGARTAAHRELSKAIYHRYDDPWPVRAFNAVQHWIGKLFAEAAKHSPGGGAGAVALLVGVAVVLVMLRWRLGPMRRNPRLARAILAGTTTTAADHRQEAIAAAGREEWSRAIVERMRALARGLEENGELPDRPGRTADELAAEVAASRTDVADVIGRAAHIFDEVAYGSRAGNADAYAVVVEADDRCSAVTSRR